MIIYELHSNILNENVDLNYNLASTKNLLHEACAFLLHYVAVAPANPLSLFSSKIQWNE